MSSRYRGSDEERRVLDAFVKMKRAVNSVTTGALEPVRSAGLTESQFGVLEALYHLDSLCQKELAEKVLRSPANLTSVIDNLEGRELVERRRHSEDRRVVTIILTPAGRRLVASVLPAHVGKLVEAFSVLDVEEQDRLGELCRRLGTGR